MKTKFGYFLVAAFTMLIACDDSVVVQNDNNENNLKRPVTVFEGKWTWLETSGEGIAGPYEKNPTSEGYTLTYDFGYIELDTYKNGAKEERFVYAYTVSEKPELQTLTLTLADGNKEHFLWTTEVKEVNGSNEEYLYLRNSEPCCDNTFVMSLKRISYPSTGGSK